MFVHHSVRIVFWVLLLSIAAAAQSVWQENLDSRVRFYQTTDFGIVLAAGDNSLFAFDSATGDRLWKRKQKGLNETSVAPVPSTDLVLISTDEGDKSRLEAIDLLSGERIWRSDKLKGDVMQLAVDPESDLLAVVLVKRARARVGSDLKRSPVIHLIKLSDGEEIWKKELESDVSMMPSGFDSESEVPFTLDNYRAPLILDGKLFVFYEGLTAYDLRNGDVKLREKFRVNEDGLALTEADITLDEQRLYVSGRGKLRALDRRTLDVVWEANDLGNIAETAIVGDRVLVRTGGQFTRIKDGEVESHGPYGVSAIDIRNGKTIWRFKGADKGITNFVIPNPETVIFADRDDVFSLDLRSGRRLGKFGHDISGAQFVLVNETGGLVVGGRDEIAAFPLGPARTQTGNLGKSRYALAAFDKDQAIWRVRHKAPGRGALRIIAGVALRAAAIYFRYGGLGTSAINLARSGVAIRSLLNLRWSGLKSRFASLDLTTLASNAASNYVQNRLTVFGIAARTSNLSARVPGLQIRRATILNQIAPSRSDIQESFLDRIDPVRRIEKLSDLLLKRKRLAELRGNYMYFYTDLPAPFDRKGLVGVNIHTGRDERFVLVTDPDPRFVADETTGTVLSADGTRLAAFEILNR